MAQPRALDVTPIQLGDYWTWEARDTTTGRLLCRGAQRHHTARAAILSAQELLARQHRVNSLAPEGASREIYTGDADEITAQVTELP